MRIRSLPLAFMTAVALAGCATHPRVQDAEPAGPPPLRVWIGYSIGSTRVHPIYVNREAHVAMFEIIPGRGVSLVYPQSRADLRAFEAHHVDLTLQPGRMFYHSDPFGHASFQPRYYYAIASVAPLNVEQLRTSFGATRRALGRMYSSFRPYDVIDRLTELVVPMQPDEDWATDLFVDWPTPLMPRSYALYTVVACANGRLIQVPSNYPYYGCPGDTAPTEPTVVASVPKPPPTKNTPFDSVARPRLPGDRGRPSGVDAPEIGERRRAEAGARPPRTRGGARSSSPGRARYDDERVSRRSGDQPARSPASERAPAPSRTERSQPVERDTPRAQPAPERGESGTERKPQ